MVQYRRNKIEGGTYFFTVALHDRERALLTEHIQELRTSVRTVMHEKPFHIDAWAVLPEHLHAIWTLPANDDDYSGRWRSIKSCFTRTIAKAGADITRNAKGEYNVWQRRYWEHTIRDDRDYETHMNYIHYNPVKHGHARQVRDWPHSTFHRYVAEGVYPADWGGSVSETDAQGFGE
jgi:putative transposase